MGMLWAVAVALGRRPEGACRPATDAPKGEDLGPLRGSKNGAAGLLSKRRHVPQVRMAALARRHRSESSPLWLLPQSPGTLLLPGMGQAPRLPRPRDHGGTSDWSCCCR